MYSGHLRFNVKLRPRSLVDLLTKCYEWSNEDASEFADFLLPMLEYDPRRRATAEDCLENPWLHRRRKQMSSTPASSTYVVATAAAAIASDSHAVPEQTCAIVKSSDVTCAAAIPTNQTSISST